MSQIKDIMSKLHDTLSDKIKFIEESLDKHEAFVEQMKDELEELIEIKNMFRNQVSNITVTPKPTTTSIPIKRGRGRPRKFPILEEVPKRPVGRPKKSTTELSSSLVRKPTQEAIIDILNKHKKGLTLAQIIDLLPQYGWKPYSNASDDLFKSIGVQMASMIKSNIVKRTNDNLYKLV